MVHAVILAQTPHLSCTASATASASPEWQASPPPRSSSSQRNVPEPMRTPAARAGFLTSLDKFEEHLAHLV
jgi:hypothetical protein